MDLILNNLLDSLKQHVPNILRYKATSRTDTDVIVTKYRKAIKNSIIIGTGLKVTVLIFPLVVKAMFPTASAVLADTVTQ